MFKILSSIRMKFKRAKKDVSDTDGQAHFNLAHNGSELVVQTWAGSWTPVGNAGAAFVGLLRTAGLGKKEIDDILYHALEVNRADE